MQATHDHPKPLPPDVARVLLLTFALLVVISIVSWLLVSLAMAAIAKAVQHIYNDDDDHASPVKSIFTALPPTFTRIVITSLWILLLEILAGIIISIPFAILSAIDIHLPLLHQTAQVATMLLVDLWYMLSVQVTVLEPELYGKAAVKRSVELARAVAPTALAVAAVYATFWFPFAGILHAAMHTPGHGEWVGYVVAGGASVVYFLFSTFWLVVMSVFYFVSSSKRGGSEPLLPEAHAYQALAE